MDDRVSLHLERGLRELGRTVPKEGMARLLGLAVLLERWAARLNLTGHRSGEKIVQGLLLEAAALEQVLPPAARLVDLGSGAGFPGLPLAILRPETRVVLVEARRRRHHFQRAAIRELGLQNADPRLGRAESLPPEPSLAVIAQAMARPERALEWMLPWAEVGGLLLLPASPEASLAGLDARLRIEERRPYRAPLGGPPRSLWVVRRTG
jgi:16S rRNA (guanine527-N7)-methyltransferase